MCAYRVPEAAPRVPRLVAVALAAAAAAVALTSCSGPAEEPAAEPTRLDGTLTIYAAASLQASFDELAELFETQNPGVDILPLVYDGSSTLATQLLEGAPADVFASADETTMTRITDEGLATDPVLFATNTLVIAVPAGNPAGIETLADLADPANTVVLCAPEVPCGAASETLLGNAGVAVTAASLEQNVTAVLTKVAAGEADAGLVYATDVKDDPDVESIVPAGADEVVNRYPIVALDATENPDAAAAFVAFVTGAEGRAVLAEYGFGAP